MDRGGSTGYARNERYRWEPRIVFARFVPNQHDNRQGLTNPMTQFATLDAWLTHLDSAHTVSIDMSLQRISEVRDALQLSFECPVITVGGSNGKGSTCAILEAILLRAGYRVGCYTSPHLLAFNERARIDGAEATDVDLLEHFE